MTSNVENKLPADNSENLKLKSFEIQLLRTWEKFNDLFLTDEDFELHQPTEILPDLKLESNADIIRQISSELLSLSHDMAELWQAPLLPAYLNRLSEIESRNPDIVNQHKDQLIESFCQDFYNWNQVQQLQALHDHLFHQQVLNWSDAHQLRHHNWHIGKLVGKLSEACLDDDFNKFKQTYLPDIFAFGIILANLNKDSLDESELNIEDFK